MVTSSAAEIRSGPHRAAAMTRAGLILAVVLALADTALGLGQVMAGGIIPDAVTLLLLGLAVVTLIAVPFAWRGSAGASWTVAATRILSALSGLPAFFIAGIPAMMVILATLGMVLAVAVAVLLLLGRTREMS